MTGLDPTIVFYMGKNRSRDLDPTDAHFVDVLHTGAGILGQWGPNGHADFYINGGSSQPGCASDTIFSNNTNSLSLRQWIHSYVFRNSGLRPYQSHPVLHRVNSN